LDLPKELRLMVYDAITIDTKSRTMLVPDSTDTLTLNVRTLPTSLLATCRFIRDEATPIFETRMRGIIEEIPRIDIQYKTPENLDGQEDLSAARKQHEVMNAIFKGVMFICRAPDMSDKVPVLEAALKDIPHLVTLYGIEDSRILYPFIGQAARYLATAPAPLPSDFPEPKVVIPVCVICLHRTREQAQSHREASELVQNIPPCKVELSTGQPPICSDFVLDPPATSSVEQ
jgi:hypothetical protein